MLRPSPRSLRAAVLLLACGTSSSALAAQRIADAEFSLRLHYNSDFPNSFESGPAWIGRGVTGVVAARVTAQAGWVTLRLAPELWRTENVPSRLSPSAGPTPYLDPMRPGGIDLPQQLGRGGAARLDPGNSALILRAFGARLALTSESRLLGSGKSHAILMSPDAPGFPRVEVGTSETIATPLGAVSFALGAGQIGQTRFAPQRRTGARSGSFFEGLWYPLRDERLMLGAARFYHRDWDGARLGNLIVPFGSLFVDPQRFGGGSADNQMLALFGRLRVRDGLEAWAEFGLNDRQTDVRETVVELEHNSAWLFGLRRDWTSTKGPLWTLEANAASARIPPVQLFRPQTTFYEHTPISQGHTNRGHLLGSRLLERTGGVEVRIERRTATTQLGLILGTRDLPNQLALAVDEANLRREWSLIAEWTHRGRYGLEYFSRLGGVADLNRHPVHGDAYSAIVSTGLTWRR